MMLEKTKTLFAASYKCFECDKPAEHFHHPIPRIYGGTKVIPLCIKCHALAHHTRMSSSVLIKRGIEKARLKGTQVGRPPRIDHRRALRLKQQGFSLSQIALQMHTTKSGVQRALKRALRVSIVKDTL